MLLEIQNTSNQDSSFYGEKGKKQICSIPYWKKESKIAKA